MAKRPGYRTDVTGLTEDEARTLFVLTTGGAHEDLGLGTAVRSALLKVLRAVPEPFCPAAAAVPAARILLSFGRRGGAVAGGGARRPGRGGGRGGCPVRGLE